MATYTDPGFGAYLRTEPDPDTLAAYRERTGHALADMPRLVTAWRTPTDAADRDSFSPAQAKKWLQEHPRADYRDLADCRIYASIWMARS